jgi:hypothetical protein
VQSYFGAAPSTLHVECNDQHQWSILMRSREFFPHTDREYRKSSPQTEKPNCPAQAALCINHKLCTRFDLLITCKLLSPGTDHTFSLDIVL